MRIILTLLSLTLLFSSGIVSCASSGGARIEEENQSLGEIKRALIAIMGEPRHTSENQREFTSQYFGRKVDAKFDPSTAKERLFAKFIILGDRRPYDIQVTVYSEERMRSAYKIVGTDPTMANQLVHDLRERLNQSREGRNIIDDFRAF